MKDNGFIYEPNPERADDFEDKLDKLLATLESLKENIIDLSRVVELQINIAYYGYKEQMWGWHLDLKTLKKLAELNIEVDFDIYPGGLSNIIINKFLAQKSHNIQQRKGYPCLFNKKKYKSYHRFALLLC